MDKRKILACAAALLLCCIPVSAEMFRGDIDRDGTVSAADAVLLSRILAEDTSLDLSAIDMDAADTDADGMITIADLPAIFETEPQWILEPKGTVHTGRATFYDSGYEDGCAMLYPDPSQYLITAMNLADYNDAELAGLIWR